MVKLVDSSSHSGADCNSLATSANDLSDDFDTKPSYNFVMLTPARPQIIRIASCSELISKLKNKTPVGLIPFFGKITFSAMFIAKLVFPIDGLAAMTIISLGRNPKTIRSISTKPDDRPVNSPRFWSIICIVPAAASIDFFIGTAQSLKRSELIEKISFSAFSIKLSRSPESLYARSIFTIDAFITRRTSSRSRTRFT